MTRAAGLALLLIAGALIVAGIVLAWTVLPGETRVVVPLAVFALLGCGAALWVDEQRKVEGRK